jgi:hypothetical protein
VVAGSAATATRSCSTSPAGSAGFAPDVFPSSADPTPQVGAFNHVIVYLPELDLYADPTAAVSFIGHLPRADRGKPVLRVSKHQVTRARTPIGTADDNTASGQARRAAEGGAMSPAPCSPTASLRPLRNPPLVYSSRGRFA